MLVTKLLIAGFLIAHGLLHLAVWATPKSSGTQPFDPSHSWPLDALGVGAEAARSLSIVLAIAAAAGFVAAGVALFVGSEWWRVLAIVAAAESLPLFLLFFNPWFTVGVAIQLGILYVLVVTHWPAESVVGA